MKDKEANPARANKKSEPSGKAAFGTQVKQEMIAWFWVVLVFLLVNGT